MKEGTCRDRANEMLPWYLNGSLGADEAAVASHVASCRVCTADLERLSMLADALARHGALADEFPRRRRGWFALAAALASLAIFGAWWITLRAPHHEPEGTTTGTPASVVLDLGAGPLRGEDAPPTLTVTGSPAVVTFRFHAPRAAGDGTRIELRDSTGRTLGTVAMPRDLDPLGRSTVSFPSALMKESGEYSILLRHSPDDGFAVPLPFRVRRTVRGSN